MTVERIGRIILTAQAMADVTRIMAQSDVEFALQLVSHARGELLKQLIEAADAASLPPDDFVVVAAVNALHQALDKAAAKAKT